MDKPGLPSLHTLFAQVEEGSATRFRWGLGQAKTLSLPEQIAAQIGDRILGSRIAPGEWVREQEVASEFGVSRSPVREAMRILEREGLVHIHPRRGAQATHLSIGQIRDLAEVRIALLQVVARKTAERRDAGVLATLQQGIAELEQLVDASDGGRFGEILSRLTLYCTAAADNERLFSMIASLSLQMSRYTRLGLSSPQRRRRSLELWRQSVDAFARGDAGTAQALWVQRLAENCDEIVRILSAEPERARH